MEGVRKMRILMIGATGRNAGLVLPQMLAYGATVRALVRDQAKADIAARAGAQETAVGDMANPNSLRHALDGVDTVFLIDPAFAEDEADLGTNMVHASQHAGVDKVVFSSVSHPSLSLTNHVAKQPVEEALYDADLRFVILQPAMFMQNLAGTLGAARNGLITVPYATDVALSFVDYRDVAEVAALAATSSTLDNGTFELAAQTTDYDTIAELFAKHLNTPVRAERIDPTEWARQLPAGPLRDGLLRMNIAYDAHGFHGGNDLVLRTILGRAPTSLTAFIRELVTGSASS
jgi:uncharacterized protein YbjT (DUF2867 family)